jgi:uncharacterized protein (TIGR02001 family)
MRPSPAASRLTLPVVCGALLTPAFALADEKRSWAVEATGASQLVSKGTGKSAGDAAFQLEATWDFDPVYIGAWGSNADVSQGGDAELHAYVGVKPKVGDVAFDLRAMVKTMPGTPGGVQSEWLELRADTTLPVAGTDLRLRVEYSPDNYAATEAAWWVEAQASRRLAEDWQVSAAYGLREQDDGADYRAWNAGITWKATETLALELRWYDTDSHERGENFDGRVYLAATVAF